jgi:hypothetical protein
MGYDYKSLTACMKKLRARDESLACDHAVTLSARRNTPLQDIVSTFDAVRTDEDGHDMFSVLLLGTDE